MPFADSLKDALRPAVQRLRTQRDTWLYGSCAVLLYHRVADLDIDPQLLAVGPAHFDAHLSILKERYHLLTVEEFDRHLRHRRRFPRNAVLLTFDDGYADNHIHARPILEKHGVQALFYITSGYLGSGREYWWDELERLLLTNRELPRELHFDSHGTRLDWCFDTEPVLGPMLAEYHYLLAELRQLPSAERDALLGRLRIALRSEHARPTHLPMTVHQLRDFATSPSVVMGAHSVGHSSLGYQREDEQRREIGGSKEALEAMLGIPVPYFSYPFGTGADFNATTLRIVEQMGFTHVAANYPGIVHARSPLFKFPRFLVRDWDGPEFRKRMDAFFRG